MAQQNPGHPSVSTGNISGGIAGVVTISGQGHSIGTTTINDRHDTHNTHYGPGAQSQKPCPATDSDGALEEVVLPDVWPDPNVHDPKNIEVVKVKNGSEMHTYFQKVLAGTSKDVYRMQRRPRGVFLLINNKNFRNGKRYGTEIDGEALTEMFKQLEFDIQPHNDCTAQDMQDILEIQFEARDHTNYDCFACAILSHGRKDMICGVDGKTLSMDTIRNIVTGSKCKSLAGKPKLFFIQACQGGERDTGVESDDESDDDGQGEEDVIYLNSEVFSDQQHNTSDEEDDYLHTAGGDLLVVHSTVTGFRARRNRKSGSWFIQALVYIISKFSHQKHIHDLLLLVKRLVTKSEARVEITPGGPSQTVKQQPAVGLDTLNRTLYFFPGLPASP